MMRLALTAAAVTLLFSGPLFAQGDSVRVELRGELPARCSISIGAPLIAENGGNVSVRIPISHVCNSRSTMMVTLNAGSTRTLSDISVRYEGRSPTQQNDVLVRFIENDPVDRVQVLEFILPNASAASAEEFTDFIGLALEPN